MPFTPSCTALFAMLIMSSSSSWGEKPRASQRRSEEVVVGAAWVLEDALDAVGAIVEARRVVVHDDGRSRSTSDGAVDS